MNRSKADMKLPREKVLVFSMIGLVGALGIMGWELSRVQRVTQSMIVAARTSAIETKEQSQSELQQSRVQLQTLQTRLAELESEDTRQKNASLSSQIQLLKSNVTAGSQEYESLVDLRASGVKTAPLESEFAQWLASLVTEPETVNQKRLATLSAKLALEKSKQASGVIKLAATAPASNQAPGSGFARQRVTVGDTEYLVSLIAADLNSTKVLVDTASDGDCADNCPVLPLATYAARTGAFAAINGSYFCPASYPSCAGKKNSFDTLLMNKDKKYFNSDNNVYSSIPAAIFSAGSARFVGKSQEWGRDTGVDSVIANYPLIVSGGQATGGDGGDGKLASRGNRSFIGNKGNTVYIGVVHGVSVPEAGRVLAALGLDNALNLDSGGSTALWVNGSYQAGPGRELPNAIVFVRR